MGSEVHFSHLQLRRDVRFSEAWTCKVTAPTLQGHMARHVHGERNALLRDSSGVFKTRTVRRLSPSLQVDVELLKGVRARPWDPSGTSVETDRFVLPLQPEQPLGLSSEGAQASKPAEPNLAQDDVPASELQPDRDDDSGDLTAGAASSGVRRPLENPDEGILGLLDLRVGDLVLIPRRSASVLQSKKLKPNKVARSSVCRHLRTLNLLTNG